MNPIMVFPEYQKHVGIGTQFLLDKLKEERHEEKCSYEYPRCDMQTLKEMNNFGGKQVLRMIHENRLIINYSANIICFNDPLASIGCLAFLPYGSPRVLFNSKWTVQYHGKEYSLTYDGEPEQNEDDMLRGILTVGAKTHLCEVI